MQQGIILTKGNLAIPREMTHVFVLRPAGQRPQTYSSSMKKTHAHGYFVIAADWAQISSIGMS